jgi:hypothetical protein
MDTTSEEQDGDNSTADRLSLTISNPKRMSMDQYYISQLAHPPDYGALTQPHQSLENVFMKKMELQGAVRRADDRNWNRVFVTLQGTALTFHKYKSSGVFGTRPEFLDDCPDLPVEGKKGEFLRSYNLHLADAGIAADCTKFVLRANHSGDTH